MFKRIRSTLHLSMTSTTIYLAHSSLSWSHGNDLIIEETVVKRHQDGKNDDRVKKLPIPNNIVVLRENGIKTLYHFTDVSNLESIREHGLLAWRKIESEKIKCR